ncbi:sulfite exporter TauE/SafE family protein [Novosphingobium sp. KCTC 2891]|uniref:sulfite exporter TauE/SafE family protein n=1 Tax=Novosphingobium sp. KCTC 2891 TaxID=2989730 RepID=UPI00222248CB|nr:sulfite exporter TauE/SafE family protein [Novosphingobium sp. KCTC 2891]MCW1382830.1 sulfite exporter TauE/SafE family protein [Novosphingobium sp. KCTC 2891]
MLEHFDILHAVAGLLVGTLVGLTGVGGGSLMTPILVLIFGVNPGTAVGTDLLFASMTKIAGSFVHNRHESVDWKIMRRLASGSVPAAIVTLIAVSWFGKVGKDTSHLILTMLGAMLILTALATLFQKKLAVLAKSHERLEDTRAVVPTIALGAVLGVAVSISSVGAGAIGVTALLMLYPALRVSRIVGTDIAHAVPLTLVAGFGHWMIGGVDSTLLLNLLMGSIPGVAIGSLLSTRSPDHILRPALAAVLLFSGVKLLGS